MEGVVANKPFSLLFSLLNKETSDQISTESFWDAICSGRMIVSISDFRAWRFTGRSRTSTSSSTSTSTTTTTIYHHERQGARSRASTRDAPRRSYLEEGIVHEIRHVALQSAQPRPHPSAAPPTVLPAASTPASRLRERVQRHLELVVAGRPQRNARLKKLGWSAVWLSQAQVHEYVNM